MRRAVAIYLAFTRDTGHRHPHLSATPGWYLGLLAAHGQDPEDIAPGAAHARSRGGRETGSGRGVTRDLARAALPSPIALVRSRFALVPKLQLGNASPGSSSFPRRSAAKLELRRLGFPSRSLGTRGARQTGSACSVVRRTSFVHWTKGSGSPPSKGPNHPNGQITKIAAALDARPPGPQSPAPSARPCQAAGRRRFVRGELPNRRAGCSQSRRPGCHSQLWEPLRLASATQVIPAPCR